MKQEKKTYTQKKQVHKKMSNKMISICRKKKIFFIDR